MLSWLLGPPNDRSRIDRLHGEIVGAARDPAFFTLYRIEDTLEGRFEILTLHAWLALRRLAALPPPAPDIAQDLTDALFRSFDIALRELGVGDTSVPKRMHHLAEAFLGRCVAYNTALQAGREALSATLARNVYSDASSPDRLVRYVEGAEAILGRATIEAFSHGPVPFPLAASITENATP